TRGPGRTPPSRWAKGTAAGQEAQETWYSAGPPPAGQPPATDGEGRPALKPLLLIGAGILAAIIIIVVIVVSIANRGSDSGAPAPSSSAAQPQASPGADGVVAENVSPFDFEAGQCFIDFQAATQSATVVTCDTPHAAQLVGTYFYEEAEEFPGKDALNVQAEEFCGAVDLNENAADYPNLRNSYGMPSEGTWEEGDRRIDCFVISDEGNTIKTSLVSE
ncbi:hypothetical protein D477_008033, partial [Arthrobacter crystallopoietes BAB-32]